MAKLVTSPISNFNVPALTTIQSNFDAIEAAIENTVSRDGSVPNQMQADLDLNHNDLLNVRSIDSASIKLNGRNLVPTDEFTALYDGRIFSTHSDAVTTGVPPYIHSIILQGWSSESDGKGGQWTDDPAKGSGDSFTTDNGTRTWYRVISPQNVLSASMFGALGNGVVDDHPALQRAVNFAAANGYRLFVPKGLYLISDNLLLPSNTHIFGAGMGQTIIKLSDTANPTASCLVNADTRRTTDNAGNVNITIEDLTADCNGRRSNATYGTAVELIHVTGASVRRVEALNGYWHCFDVTSAVNTVPNNESYPHGPSSQILIENCVARDPVMDDAFTTHYSSHIVLINPRSIMDASRVVRYNQSGVEIDEGSRHIIVIGGYANNFATGLQVKGHSATPAAQDVMVIGFVAEGCILSFQIEHSTLRSTTARNLTLLNCKSLKPKFLNPNPVEHTSIKHIQAKAYSNLRVENFHAIGDPSKTGVDDVGCIDIASNVRNSLFDGIFLKDINRPQGAIRVPSSVGENVTIRRVSAVDCRDLIGYLTASGGIVVEDWYAELSNPVPVVAAMIKINDSTWGSSRVSIKNIRNTGGYTKTIINEDASRSAETVSHADEAGFKSFTASLTTDTATSFMLPATGSAVFATCTVASSTFGTGAPRGMFSCRATTSPQIHPIAFAQTQNGVTLTTGVLTGTTGASGQFTISVATDGRLYLENRTGTTQTITVHCVGG